MFNKIWERHSITQLCKTFLLLVVGFYALYVLIDYSSRTGAYRGSHFSYYEILGYYLYTFIQRLDILIPFALMIATVKTLCSLNLGNELVALISSGIPLKRILRPFLIFGLFLSAFLFLNTQIFLPQALKKLNHLKDRHYQLRQKKQAPSSIQKLLLNDESILLYQHYDTARDLFFDVYWVTSFDGVYRIKYLYPMKNPPEGLQVVHLVRNEKGQLLRRETEKKMLFSKMEFGEKSLKHSLIPPSDQSLTQLWNELPSKSGAYNDKEALVISAFGKKFIMPWLCLLAIVGPAPFCLHFSRQLPVFLIYLLSMFGMLAAYILINCFTILGESQVISPFLSPLILLTVFTSIIGLCYFKLK